MDDDPCPERHPLLDHQVLIGAALQHAIDDAAGLSGPPRTLAEQDQHAKAVADVEAMVHRLLASERAAAAAQ